MPTPNVLDSRIQERDQAISAARVLAESDEFNPEDKTFVDLQTRASELDKSIDALAALLDHQATVDQFDSQRARAAQQQRQQQQPQTRESWGAAFVRSAEFTSYGYRGTSGRFHVDNEIETRALPTGIADLVAAGMRGTIYSVDVSKPPAPTPLLDNVTGVQVSGNSVEIVSWAKKAGGATVVAEKTAKPSAEWGPTVVPAVLDTVAVWTKLTRQLLEDANAVRTLIDNELRRDVLREAEAQAVAALAGAAATIPDVVNADLLAGIRIGIGTVQAAGYTPTAVLLNPADWAKFDVSIMGDTLNGPRVNQTFWGLTPIPATTQAAGSAVVGDFRAAIQHYYRSQVALYTSDSAFDGDFTKNLFTILAEQRSKTVVVRPQALVEAKIA